MSESTSAVRCQTLRRYIIDAIAAAGSGHVGSSLSCIDILDVLFFELECGRDPAHHRFVMSKGHAESALYSIFCHLDWISHQELLSMRQFGSRLQGHPDPLWLPQVEYAGGSLGQGLSFAQGLADGLGSGHYVYALLSDGELQEGQTWEAFFSIPRMQTNNLRVIIDCNGFQLCGPTPTTPAIETYTIILRQAGWTVSLCSGHDAESLRVALTEETSTPHVIFARTVKGKGIPFMENNNYYHGRGLNQQEIEAARFALAEGGGR
jgi:transketolase